MKKSIVLGSLTFLALSTLSFTAHAEEFPPRGSELESKCNIYMAAIWNNPSDIDGGTPKNLAVIAEALKLNAEELQTVSQNLAEVVKIDPKKRDEHLNLGYFLCTTKLSSEEISEVRSMLLEKR